jgi:hypothetical protein
MKNHQIEAAWAYHDGTKHSYDSLRRNAHYLDWDNQPLVFKIYPKLEPIPLSPNLSSPGMPALTAISAPSVGSEAQVLPTSQTLSEILFLSAGITRRRSYSGGEMLFRAAACTGALYHIDLYVVCGDLEGLEAGVYHFSPQDFALRKLRAGDYRSVLVDATGEEPAIAHAPASSSARRRTGATPGSTRRALTATAIGTAALSSPTSWPRPRLAQCRRSCSSVSWMLRSTSF